MLQTPLKGFLVFRRSLFLRQGGRFLREGRHEHILFHSHPFSPPSLMIHGHVDRSITCRSPDVNGFAFLLFASSSCYNRSHAGHFYDGAGWRPGRTAPPPDSASSETGGALRGKIPHH